jgi:phosphoesterase RecJ-like protein
MNVEGDALGSALAMYALLKKLKKRAVLYLNDAVPDIYKFLPSSRMIKNTFRKERFDTVIVLDCSDSSRTGKVKDSLGCADCIVNIDHHISNTHFGDINWIAPQASSACQLLYELCRQFGVMDDEIALCLYTGIATDTGNFTFSSADSRVHKIIADLMKHNIKPNRVFENIHSACEIHDLKLITGLMASLKLDMSRKICWVAADKWEDKGFDLTEIIFSIMRLLKGVEVFMIFKQISANKVRVNFRSREYVDVNKIAKFFGGGGHRRASGTTVEGNLKAIEDKVISFVKKHAYIYKNGYKKK